MLLGLSTRGMVRSAHLAPYRTHAAGSQYERYGEISPSRTLSDSCCWVSVREVWWDQSISHLIGLMLLGFSTRGMVRSVHLAPYRTHAAGFQYERYGEISPSCTRSFTLHSTELISLIFLFQILHRWLSWLPRNTLISAQVTTPRPRLKARAWCCDLCWDEPI